MKIISLNTWCGRTGETIYQFFQKYKNVDIFCLQEVDLDGTQFGPEVIGNREDALPQNDPQLFSSLQDILDDHHGYFSPILGRWWGNTIFIKKSLYRRVTAYGECMISDNQQQYVPYETWFRRMIQWIDITINHTEYTIINIHGLWEKDKGKGDSPDRIEQSINILKFLETRRDRNIILIGDFNLNPDTQSIHMIEDFGLKNLIKEYDITDTRTSLYKKENRYADYALVSPDIVIKKFEILPDEVSDHATLYLEIEV